MPKNAEELCTRVSKCVAHHPDGGAVASLQVHPFSHSIGYWRSGMVDPLLVEALALLARLLSGLTTYLIIPISSAHSPLTPSAFLPTFIAPHKK